MEEKLRSISRQIHWSLVLRAALFSLAWFYLPFWFFLIVALACYLKPLLRVAKLAVPFLVLILICAMQAPNGIMACILGVIFYYILLTKELLLINRTAARWSLAMVLSFFLLREFYALFQSFSFETILLPVMGVGAVFGVVVHNFLSNIHVTSSEDNQNWDRSFTIVISLLSFLMIAQYMIMVFFMPLNFIYQSLVAFLGAALILFFAPNALSKTWPLDTIRLGLLAFSILFVIVLASAQWALH